MDLKICGLCHKDDLAFCLSLGIPYVGFILVSSSKRVVSANEVHKMWAASHVKAGRSKPVFVVADEDLGNLRRLAKDWQTQFKQKPCVQLHGSESTHFVEEVQNSEVFDEVWKALRIGRESPTSLMPSYQHTDLILLDGSSPGSGESFDWSMIPDVDQKTRWGLAGGINDRNIQQAIACKPNLIDVSSGSERALREKDHNKISRLWQAVRSFKTPE